MRKIRVDMDALMSAFKDRDYDQSHYLDLETGEVILIPEADFEEEDLHPVAAEVDSHPDRYLALPVPDPDDVLEHLADYVRDLEDEEVRERLGLALQEGVESVECDAFFDGHPELAEGWQAFHQVRLEQQVRAWLAQQGVEPLEVAH